MVVGGSLTEGVEVKLDPGASVEDVRVGSFVSIRASACASRCRHRRRPRRDRPGPQGHAPRRLQPLHRPRRLRHRRLRRPEGRAHACHWRSRRRAGRGRPLARQDRPGPLLHRIRRHRRRHRNRLRRPQRAQVLDRQPHGHGVKALHRRRGARQAQQRRLRQEWHR